MGNPTGRVLRPVVMPGFSRRFQRVDRNPKTWVLARGLGLLFPTCWSGSMTMLHHSSGDCPNCSRDESEIGYRPPAEPTDKLADRPFDPGLYRASQRIGSMHAVRDASTSSFCNLFLPDGPTRFLLSHDASEMNGNTVRLHTRRRGPNAGKVDVEVEVHERVKAVSEKDQAAVMSHLADQVCRFFAGNIPAEHASRLLYSWPKEGHQVGS